MKASVVRIEHQDAALNLAGPAWCVLRIVTDRARAQLYVLHNDGSSVIGRKQSK
jgi:hypothetical protein